MDYDVADLVGHNIDSFKFDMDRRRLPHISFTFDNGIVIEPIEIDPGEFIHGGFGSAEELARFIERIGRKVLAVHFIEKSYNYMMCVDIVIGKTPDGTCFKLRVYPEMVKWS